MMFVYTLSMVLGLTWSADQGAIARALSEYPIVRATVMEANRLPTGIIATKQRIDAIYCGPSRLLGTEFLEHGIASDGGGQFRGLPPLSPPLNVGDECVFFLRELPDMALIRHWGPARPDGSAQSRELHDVADAAAFVWRLQDEPARKARLQALICGSSELVATWALTVLQATYPNQVAALVSSESNAVRSPNVLIMLDEAMSASMGDEWLRHPDHRSLWNRVAATAEDEKTDFNRLVHQLATAYQRKQVDASRVFAIASMLVNRDSLSIEIRKAALQLFRLWVNDETLEGRHIDILLSHIERGGKADATRDETYLRNAAFDAIAKLNIANDEQIRRLVTLRDDAQVRVSGASDKGRSDQGDSPMRDLQVLNEIIRRVTAKQPASSPATQMSGIGC